MSAPTAPCATTPRKKRRRKAPAAADGNALGQRRERLAALGATLAALGLADVGTGSSLGGALTTLAGLVLMMFAIHKYGRLGEER